MMTTMKHFYFGVLVMLITGLSAIADQQISSVEGIARVTAKHGAKFTEKIVEMKGSRGQAQPEEWRLIVYDPSSESMLREFWIGDTRATNEGSNDDYYPKHQPAGFIDGKKLKLGSVEAFNILNGEASRAKVGFDSIDYHLRCREFSDEPIWTLRARDAEGNQVARIDLSGMTGRLLRTVWSYRSGRKVPLIRDSALLTLQAPTALVDDAADPSRRLPAGDLPISPAGRREPLVPAPPEPGNGLNDPGTEVPEVVPIEPGEPRSRTLPVPIPAPTEP